MPHSTANNLRNIPSNDSRATPKQRQPKTPPEKPVEPSVHGLRAHLQHLLPRHAVFHVRVQIHQISSVPLVHGHFGVRWKFRRVKSSAGSAVNLEKLTRGKAEVQAESTATKRDLKGKGKTLAVDEDGSFDSGENSLASSFVSISDQIPSVVVSQSGDSSTNTSLHSTPFLSTASASSHDSNFTSSSSNDSHEHPSSANSSPHSHSKPTRPTYSPARGITPYYKLKDHAVTWEHSLNVLVKMDIDRETSELQSNVLKLGVMQKVISGDPDAPQNPRLGVVYLDLAQYAGVGEAVTRRYLLRKSKTNATLKLTTEVIFVSGDSNYNAPILPKGEILNGVAGLLDSDIYKTRPRALELWGPYHNQQELELDLLGGASIPDPNDPRPHHKHRNRSRSRVRTRSGNSNESGNAHHHQSDHSDDDDVFHDASQDSESETDTDGDRYEVPFDVSRLPLAYGPKTTEILIEALFNPVKVVKPPERIAKEKESPFEMFVDAEEEKLRRERARERRRQEQEQGDGKPFDRERTIGPWNGYKIANSGEAGSVYSTDSASVGHSTEEHSARGSGSTGSHDDHDGGKGKNARAWWAKRRPGSSRPATPAVAAR
ncbi:hypothetical protein V5O48_006657 [Marasmius crinis-equi]|uniref:C2 NT-type domain-containing protein n=1 Tax=Marasmius crinis-equi TaxID=585013 RepID=A0ABR3FIY0_9AGAR